MMLHALNAYYARMRANPNTQMPAFGTSVENISFALVLAEDGRLCGIDDLREEDGGKRRPRKMPVPAAVTRTSGTKSNFIWDKAAYVLGADSDGVTAKNKERFEAFESFLLDVGNDMKDVGFQAVVSFLQSWNPEQTKDLIEPFASWEDISNANLVFRLDGVPGFIHDRPEIHQRWLDYGQKDSDAPMGQCLISGDKNVSLARIHTPIKGVRGGQTSGGYIVSFNASAFVSYGQDKASVSESAAFAYTTALNYLLTSDSRQKMTIGDTTYVFWATHSTPVESFFAEMFDMPAEKDDATEAQDDTQSTSDIHGLLQAIRDGRRPVDFMPDLDEEVKFYILGLAPNAARVSIRFWQESSLGDLLKKIGLHYRDLNMVRQFDSEPEFPSVWRLLLQTATLGKTENISPVLAGGLARAMLTGAPYPQNLMPVVLDRIRAEHHVTYFRAALLKAYLVRNTMKEVPVSFDPDRTDLPYVLGRLFSVLEKAQEEAIPRANATIKDRYLAAAAATPAQVFNILLKNSTNHIAKLRKDPEKKGRSIFLEKMIGDIINMFTDYPKTLKAVDQSLFMIGYYHQRKDFYTKKV